MALIGDCRKEKKRKEKEKGKQRGLQLLGKEKNQNGMLHAIKTKEYCEVRQLV
jgi:hypothetical protein